MKLMLVFALGVAFGVWASKHEEKASNQVDNRVVCPQCPACPDSKVIDNSQVISDLFDNCQKVIQESRDNETSCQRRLMDCESSWSACRDEPDPVCD